MTDFLARNLIRDADPALEISHNDREGRILVATRDIQPGEVLIKEKPINHGPRYNTKPCCLGCYKYVSEKSPCCKACGWPLCALDCPALSNHALECRLYAQLNRKVNAKKFNFHGTEPLYDIICPLRILLQRDSEQGKQQHDQFMALESHWEAWKDEPEFIKEHKAVHTYFKDTLNLKVSEEDVQKIFGRFYINDFSIRPRQEQGSSCGQGQSPSAVTQLEWPKIRLSYCLVAMASHSCQPNTWRNIAGPEFGYLQTVHAKQLIRKGEPVFTTYQDLMLPGVIRREQLYEGKKFWCQCARCLDPGEFGTQAGSLLCPQCQQAVIYSKPRMDHLSPGPLWKCLNSGCKYQLPYQEAKNIQLDALAAIEASMEEGASVEKYEALLTKFQDILHPNNMLLCLLKYNLCGMYGRLPGYQMGQLSLHQLQRKKKHCTQVLEVMKKLETGISHIKAIVLYELHMPTIMLAQMALQGGTLDQADGEQEFRKGLNQLKLSLELLKHEPEGSFERRLYEESQGSVAALEKHIQAAFGSKNVKKKHRR